MNWLTPTAADRRFVEELDQDDDSVRLATLLAPALRIDVTLLRNMRMHYLPRSDASLESALWFSDLVISRSVRAISFPPGVARLLTDQLETAQQQRPSLPEVAMFVQHHAADWPRETRLEQQLRLAARADDTATVRSGLRSVLRWFEEATDDNARQEILRWVRGAVPKLVRPEWELEEAHWLIQIAAAVLGDTTGDLAKGNLNAREMPSWLSQRLPAHSDNKLGLNELGLNVRPGQLQFVEAGKGAHNLAVGPAIPALLGLQSDDSNKTRWEQIWAGQILSIRRDTQRLTLITLSGNSYNLLIEERLKPSTKPHLPERIRLLHLPEEEKEASELARRLKEIGISVKLVIDEPGRQDTSQHKSERDAPAIRLWTRRSAKRYIETDVSTDPWRGLIVRLDDVPLMEGMYDISPVDLFEGNKRFSEKGLERLRGALSDTGKSKNKPTGHIFISYAAEDRSRVASLASLLEAEGWPVWWDRENIPPGQRFHRVIDEAIQNAFYVLVCWSEASLESDWVIDEANEAKQQGKLLPMLLDEVRPPYGFRNDDYIDLSAWNGERNHDSYQRLAKALADKQPPSNVDEDTQRSTISSGKQDSISENKAYSANMQALIEQLDDPSTGPKERLVIGNQLAKLNDPRPGVGLDEQGLPDIDWVEIPGGGFLYGEEKESRELPAFFIGRYPVTNAQFQAFIDDGGYKEATWWEGLAKRIDKPKKPEFPESNRPRETVSWCEAIAFCRWLSDKLGYAVQLPTEMQWERAARGTDGRSYPWGDDYRSEYANVDETTGNSGPNFLQQTTAVGIYPQGASPEGVLDLWGNVWEWCLNEYNDPENTSLEGDKDRVLRGGSWRYFPEDARSSYRYGYDPDFRDYDIGFRVLCSSPISR